MLSCREVSEMVTEYLERSLPIRLRLALKWYLARCGACRAYVDQMRKLTALLGRAGGRSLSPEVADRLAGQAPGVAGADSGGGRLTDC